MTDAKLPITLVMVSYNKADTIGLSIQSAASGTRKPDLIVISDDGSSDGTPDVAEAAAARFGIPLRIIRHQRVGRFRLQTMRNTCAQNALDDGIVYLSDSDCIFGPHAIETHHRMHVEDGPASIVLGTGPRFEFLSGNSGPFTTTFTTLEFAHHPDATYVVPVGANYSFKKSTWNRLGGFDRAYDGAYGMDEFEFARRAEGIGAVAKSDPGAYVFHIPHETVFGNRNAFRNIDLFDRTFGIRHIELEHRFIVEHVIPWYWRGERKAPRVGLTACPLDEYGAPAGFRPPLHLQLMNSLMPLIEPARNFVRAKRKSEVDGIRVVLERINEQLLAPASVPNLYQQDLRWVVNAFRETDELVARVSHWLEGAEHMEKQLSARARKPVLV
ncbi:MAG: glycosyltransferase family 2 protein [Planctomycetota bacterium]